MKAALFANGMIGGDSLTKEVQSLTTRAEQLRAGLLDSDQTVVEEEFAWEAPLPATAEAEPDGA